MKLNNKINIEFMHLLSLTGIIVLATLFIYGYNSGYLTSIEELQKLMKEYGVIAPLIFILSQVVQVVFPIVPGGLGCLAGVFLFGPYWGFLYNYIGIVIGSLIVFGISRLYGKRLLFLFFPKRTIAKYMKWTREGNRFTKLFALAIFFPVAPDDLLCYIAGTTKMKWREFTLIIVLGKPMSIALYSLVLVVLYEQVITFIKSIGF